MALGAGDIVVPQLAVVTFGTVFLHDFSRAGVLAISVTMAAVQTGAAIARVWSGAWTDRRGNRRAYMRACSVLTAVFFASLALVTGLAGLHHAAMTVVFALMIVLGGVSASAWHGVTFDGTATLAGTSRAGTALAIGNTCVFLTLFLTPLAIPLLLSVGSWPMVWAVASVCALIALPVFRVPLAPASWRRRALVMPHDGATVAGGVRPLVLFVIFQAVGAAGARYRCVVLQPEINSEREIFEHSNCINTHSYFYSFAMGYQILGGFRNGSDLPGCSGGFMADHGAHLGREAAKTSVDASGIIPARSPNTPTTTERSHSETSSYSGGRSSFRFAWRSGRAGNACRCHRCRRSGDAHFIDQTAAGTPCDVLVTDLTMPEESGAVEDGLNLVRRIRSGWPSLHIVVMTALTNTAILRAIVSDSVVSTLSKMETMDELWQAIEAASRGKVYIGRSIIEGR